MPRPIVATIHLPALQHNLAQLRQRAGTARVWGVVKADAYGHGITRVWPALRAADGLACLDLDEAKLLRELGWRAPVLPQSMYIFKQPQIGGESTAHQDSGFLYTTPRQTCIGIWLALHPATLENGANRPAGSVQ